jgi:hypothetical protein
MWTRRAGRAVPSRDREGTVPGALSVHCGPRSSKPAMNPARERGERSGKPRARTPVRCCPPMSSRGQTGPKTGAAGGPPPRKASEGKSQKFCRVALLRARLRSASHNRALLAGPVGRRSEGRKESRRPQGSALLCPAGGGTGAGGGISFSRMRGIRTGSPRHESTPACSPGACPPATSSLGRDIAPEPVRLEAPCLCGAFAVLTARG